MGLGLGRGPIKFLGLGFGPRVGSIWGWETIPEVLLREGLVEALPVVVHDPPRVPAEWAMAGLTGVRRGMARDLGGGVGMPDPEFHALQQALVDVAFVQLGIPDDPDHPT